MKKFICAISVLLFATLSSVFALNMELKHYSDSSKGYDGWVVVSRVKNLGKKAAGNEDTLLKFLDMEMSETMQAVPTLPDNIAWFTKSALSEQKKLKQGQLYAVFCSDSPDFVKGTLVLALIKPDGSYVCDAYLVTEEDLNNIM